MKNILKKMAIICVITIMLIGSLSMLTACFSYTPWHGIPTGRYHPINASGEAMRNLDPILSWQISTKQARRVYMSFQIIERDNEIYFHWASSSPEGTVWYFRVEYDESTGILTVYNPVHFDSPSLRGEIKPHFFKR